MMCGCIPVRRGGGYSRMLGAAGGVLMYCAECKAGGVLGRNAAGCSDMGGPMSIPGM